MSYTELSITSLTDSWMVSLLLFLQADVLCVLSHKSIIQFYGAVTKQPNFCLVTGNTLSKLFVCYGAREARGILRGVYANFP